MKAKEEQLQLEIKRPVGRPKAPSKLVRVPLGCLKEVEAVIERYRSKLHNG